MQRIFDKYASIWFSMEAAEGFGDGVVEDPGQPRRRLLRQLPPRPRQRLPPPPHLPLHRHRLRRHSTRQSSKDQ